MLFLLLVSKIGINVLIFLLFIFLEKFFFRDDFYLVVQYE